MPRTTGWSTLAMTALELTVLALLTRLHARPDTTAASPASLHRDAFVPDHDTAPAQMPHETVQEFLTDCAGERARYYRACDELGAVLAGFYADGRVRLADATHRLAGIVQNGRADMLEIDEETWSELFVRVTPEGRMQLELRGGPYDARVLTCEEQ